MMTKEERCRLALGYHRQHYNCGQSMLGAFRDLTGLTEEQCWGLGSGLGYLLAVMLVTEADRRLRSEAIPEAFRGLPITLIYIGVLALAIYGFTGHSVIL